MSRGDGHLESVVSHAVYDQSILTELRKLLAALYPTEADQRRLAAEARLTVGAIPFASSAYDSWHQILHHAKHNRGVEALLALALDEFPENEQLRCLSNGSPSRVLDGGALPGRALPTPSPCSSKSSRASHPWFTCRTWLSACRAHVPWPRSCAQMGAVAPASSSRAIGCIELARSSARRGDLVNIIQHPGGGPKQVGLSFDVVAFAGAGRLQYLTDTLPGASGAPVFDRNWNLVALHHSGGWLVEPGSTQKRVYYRNEGILVDRIIDQIG